MSAGRPHALASLEARLAALEAEGRRRRRAPLHDASSLRLCSNDYLGYATRGLVPMPDGPRGAGASRLVAGTFPEHEALEADVADWLGHEDPVETLRTYAHLWPTDEGRAVAVVEEALAGLSVSSLP